MCQDYFVTWQKYITSVQSSDWTFSLLDNKNILEICGPGGLGVEGTVLSKTGPSQSAKQHRSILNNKHKITSTSLSEH